MWIKRASFVYHAALLVANTDALPRKNDDTLSQRQHAVEDLEAPIVWRRQESLRNETRPADTFPTTFGSRTSQIVAVPTSDQSQAISISISTSKSSASSLVITSTSSSFQEFTRLSPISSLISITSSTASSHASLRPTTTVQIDTVSSTLERSSSRASSVTSTDLSSDQTSERTSSLSSSVTSDHGPSEINHLSSVVLGSSWTITSYSTPTPTPQTLNLVQTSSTLSTNSRSQLAVHDSTFPSSSTTSTSILLHSSQTLSASASPAASDDLPSGPTPTPSMVSQTNKSTNENPVSVSKSDSSTLTTSQARTIPETIVSTPTLSSASTVPPIAAVSPASTLSPASALPPVSTPPPVFTSSPVSTPSPVSPLSPGSTVSPGSTLSPASTLSSRSTFSLISTLPLVFTLSPASTVSLASTSPLVTTFSPVSTLSPTSTLSQVFLISLASVILPESTLSPATSFISDGTPLFNQSISSAIASIIQTANGIVLTSTSTPVLSSSQFPEFPVANPTLLSLSLATTMGTTMAKVNPPPASDSGVQSTGRSTSTPATSVATISSKFDTMSSVEPGSRSSTASTISASTVLVGSPTVVPPLKSITQDINNQTSTQRLIVSATTFSTAISTVATSPNVTNTSNPKSGLLPTSLSSLLQTTQATRMWANVTTRSSLTQSGSAQPTIIFSNPNQTRTGEVDKTLIPFLSNFSINVTPLATTISTNNAATETGTTTLSETRPSDSTTQLVLVAPVPTNTISPTATSTIPQVVAAPPPAPLTTTQAAGVAVGSTAGVLLAVVAAIFLVRRYHANQAARRTSNASIYPKVAYIYDPANRGNGGSNGGSSTALMSGGASGFLPEPPQNTRAIDPRQSVGFGTRYSDPGNPFRDPVNPFRDIEGPIPEHFNGERDSLHALVDATTAFAAAAVGLAASEQRAPTTSRYSRPHSSYHVTYPSPTMNPLVTNSNFYPRHTRSISTSSVTSFSNRYPPLSPYAQPANHSEELERTTTILDAPEEPFEYDILMPIDTQSETADSVMVHAMSLPPRTPVPLTQRSGPSVSPVSPVGTYNFQQSRERLDTSLASSSTTTLGQLDRFSLAYNNHSGATYIRVGSKDSSPQQPAPSNSPVSPIVPAHRGWDDIKRYSSENSVTSSQFKPAPLSFSAPPLPQPSPPPAKKKKSLLQLRRKEPALAGQGHTLKSSISQPSMMKPAPKYDNGLAFEVQRRSLLAKLNSMGGQRTHSPASSASSSDFSHESGFKRKRDEHPAPAHTRMNGNFF